MAKLTLRIWILIIALLLALLMIGISFKTGVLIKSVEKNSTAFDEGVRAGMIIKSINGNTIKDVDDYSKVISSLFQGGNETKKVTIKTDKDEFDLLLNKAPEITVAKIPRTKVKTGLDLSGGARALLKPANVTLTQNQLDDLVAVTSQRLNAFGLSDVTVRAAKDLDGQGYMLVEIAGVTPADLRDLVGKQGKFEAKVGNVSVFEGGKKDISDVCRNDASCAAVTQCSPVQTGGYGCNFQFVLYLTEEAAQRHAEVTKNIPLDSTGQYLSDKLYLYLDGNEVDSLLISKDLKGQTTTQISIQGSGTGTTQEDALNDAKANMNKLQTILITGSLPYKLEIVKLDSISPSLGEEFSRSLLILGLAVFLVVSIVIFIRYRNVKLSLAVILTMFAEAFITIGIASLIKWNLDAAGIAGIIAGIGTGVGDQILLLDASNEEEGGPGIKERIKLAFFIIIGSFVTNVASMIPLFWTGAGMLKGFALTTILGVSVGILITRPAFSDIIKKIHG